MKRVLSTLISVLLIITMPSACKEGEKKDDSKLEPLLTLLFLAPNDEIMEAVEKTVNAYDPDTSEQKNFIEPFFEEYVISDYIGAVIGNYSTICGYASEFGGKSHLEDISVKVEEGSDTKGFTASVFCENSAGETETIKIKGTFRHDEDGKIVNIKFSSGMSQFDQFFK